MKFFQLDRNLIITGEELNMSSWPIRQGAVFGIFPPASPPPTLPFLMVSKDFFYFAWSCGGPSLFLDMTINNFIN
jgi:hypothetical protein